MPDMLNEGPLKGVDLNAYFKLHEPYIFCLRVASDAMQQEGIMINDIVVIDRHRMYKDNDLLVVAMQGQFLIRRLDSLNKDGQPVLRAANDKFADIQLLDQTTVFGVVVGVIRKTVGK